MQQRSRPQTQPADALQEKLGLFLHQAKIDQDADLSDQILRHLMANNRNYVLFRHSLLYFFSGEEIRNIEQTYDQYKDPNYWRFDGKKVTKIDPEYYLGPTQSRGFWETESQQTGWYGAADIEYSNNNNNNNNNNGNNNGNNG
ncbi:hypothetical protein L6R29_12120 [Myxococcota bacterium]|nr:hypothetical protein [Myxococcota bacterium]